MRDHGGLWVASIGRPATGHQLPGNGHQPSANDHQLL